MVCQVCKKHPATMRFIEVQDKQSSELHLCQSCAEEKGLAIKVVSKKGWHADLLAKLVDDVATDESTKVGPVQCDSCGMLYSSFKESGRFGCAQCYRTFAVKLRPLLRRIHGNTRHVGKHPVGDEESVALTREVQQMEDKLQQAIDVENFELAADLRDRIQNLQIVEIDKGEKEPEGE